jgi:hypothetical protein
MGFAEAMPDNHIGHTPRAKPEPKARPPEKGTRRTTVDFHRGRIE